MKNRKHHHRFNSELCDDSMTFQDCELAILRHAVDETETIQSQKIANSDEIKRMIESGQRGDIRLQSNDIISLFVAQKQYEIELKKIELEVEKIKFKREKFEYELGLKFIKEKYPSIEE